MVIAERLTSYLIIMLYLIFLCVRYSLIYVFFSSLISSSSLHTFFSFVLLALFHSLSYLSPTFIWLVMLLLLLWVFFVASHVQITGFTIISAHLVKWFLWLDRNRIYCALICLLLRIPKHPQKTKWNVALIFLSTEVWKKKRKPAYWLRNISCFLLAFFCWNTHTQPFHTYKIEK